MDFSEQTSPWPKRTIDAEVDLERGHTLAIKELNGLDACRSGHSEAQLGLLDKPIVSPRASR